MGLTAELARRLAGLRFEALGEAAIAQATRLTRSDRSVPPPRPVC
jgi:hypothetical protein